MKKDSVDDSRTTLLVKSGTIQRGEKRVVAKEDKPKNKIKFGTAAGKLHYTDEDFVGLDPDIQEMFYGKDWDKKNPAIC